MAWRMLRTSPVRYLHTSLSDTGEMDLSSPAPRERDEAPMIRAGFVCSGLLAAALLVSGCAGKTLTQDEQQSLATAATAAPKLQPGDKIKVTVFGEDQLSGEYQLDQSGQISLPLAGTVQALGLTQSELEQALANKFRGQYLKNPKVTITIDTLRPFYVWVRFRNRVNIPTRVVSTCSPQ